MRRRHFGEGGTPLLRQTHSHGARGRPAGTLRSISPDSASRSTSPVTLPFETIIRRDSSPSSRPSSTRSSCARRSKRGSVVPKRRAGAGGPRLRSGWRSPAAAARAATPADDPWTVGDLRFRVDVIAEGNDAGTGWDGAVHRGRSRAGPSGAKDCFMSKQSPDCGQVCRLSTRRSSHFSSERASQPPIHLRQRDRRDQLARIGMPRRGEQRVGRAGLDDLARRA